MDNRLFSIDPLAGVAYGYYNALKKEGGSFEDFLLHYDSQGMSEGDQSWLTRMMYGENPLEAAAPELFGALAQFNISMPTSLYGGDYFDTQVLSLKYKLYEEMAKRNKETDKNSA